MANRIKRFYDRMGKKVYSPYANILLGFLFYLEAIFFLPTDPILIVYCIERRDRALLYATIATISSVLGGITSYVLGSYLWEMAGQQIIYNTYLNFLFSPEKILAAMDSYRQNEVFAIFFAGFTPVPYKLATLTAGFCKLNIIPFIVCSFFARGARFYGLAIIIKIFGVQLKETIDRYFNIILVLTLVIIALSIWLFT